MKKKTEFIVEPNRKAYGTFIECLVLALMCVGACALCFNSYGDRATVLEYILTAVMWGIGIATFLILGISLVYKRVDVEDNELIIRNIFWKKHHLKTSDIKEYTFETHDKIGKDVHMIVVKIDRKTFILQDTFTKNYDLFAKYLIKNANPKPISPRK